MHGDRTRERRAETTRAGEKTGRETRTETQTERRPAGTSEIQCAFMDEENWIWVNRGSHCMQTGPATSARTPTNSKSDSF
jgi:hypothetical protein